MKKTSLYLPETLDDGLGLLALRSGKSRAEIVRELIADAVSQMHLDEDEEFDWPELHLGGVGSKEQRRSEIVANIERRVSRR